MASERAGSSIASSIAARRFRITRRGYDTDQVHDYLEELAMAVWELESQARWQQSRIETLERRHGSDDQSAYDRVAARVAEVLHAADEAAERLRKQAEDEASAVLARAHAEAEEIVARARGSVAEQANASGATERQPAPLEFDVDLGLDLDLAFEPQTRA